jgi:hypothetical protein
MSEWVGYGEAKVERRDCKICIITCNHTVVSVQVCLAHLTVLWCFAV